MEHSIRGEDRLIIIGSARLFLEGQGLFYVPFEVTKVWDERIKFPQEIREFPIDYGMCNNF